jgi:hypothetical protein
MAAQEEYAPAMWEMGDVDSIPEISLDTTIPGKFKSTMTNILSRHGTEVKLLSEESIQTTSQLSKKKLKDLITKQNNEIMAFLSNSDKTPQLLGAAETIFRRFGQEIPTIRMNQRSPLKDLNVDVSLEHAYQELNDGVKLLKGCGSLDDLMSQLKWLTNQYKNIGEEVLRLETLLFQKIDRLDKVNQRIPMITTLTENEALPELVSAFTKYSKSIYESSHFEENYIQLMEGYKKWNLCRQLLSVQQMMQKDTSDPSCSICLLEPVSHAIAPCGHTFCGTCSRKQNTTCFICRGQIRERIKLFFA